jgi:hypothetical protein
VQESSREYEIKAAFLFNFGQFVRWPEEAFSDPLAPFVIGVLGDDPFGETLDRMVAGEQVSNHPMVVERYQDPDEVGHCHVLFVSGSETPRLDFIFETLAGRHILTVGEAPGFTEQSGVIRFVIVDNKLRLEINVAAAERAGLRISSQLLRQSDVRREGSRS